jgi:hypothetical protein
MNKQAMIMVLVTSLSVVLCAQVTTNTASSAKPGKKMDPETRAKLMAVTGGFIQMPAKGPAVRFVNLQQSVSLPALEQATELIKNSAGVSASVMNKTGKDVAVVKETKALPDTLAVVVIREVPGEPALLVAPEEMWAMVNVAALKQGVSQDVLDARTQKEMWRAVGYLLGVANSASATTLMSPVEKPSELDAITSQRLNMENLIKVQQNAVKKGVTPARMSTYKKACEEGWAPMPTNSIQNAIWEDVKAKKTTTPKPSVTK